MQITDEMVQRALDAWFGERTPKWRNARLTDVQAAETFMRAALSTALAAPADDGWQPIETAPKDGLVDLCKAGSDVRYIRCYYDRICDEWRTTQPAGRLFCIPRHVPTHWRPLPATPLREPT